MDLTAGTLRLEPGTTKNRECRVVYLTPELERVVTCSWKLGRILPHLFTHLTGCYTGTPRQNFRKAWENAIAGSGFSGKLKHDFRRTAVRNMEWAGMPRSAAMKITGHKTESVYRRYAIVCDADLRDATRRLMGTFTGTDSVSSSVSPVDRHA